MKIKVIIDIYRTLRRYDEYRVRDLLEWAKAPFTEICVIHVEKGATSVRYTRNFRLIGYLLSIKAF